MRGEGDRVGSGGRAITGNVKACSVVEEVIIEVVILVGVSVFESDGEAEGGHFGGKIKDGAPRGVA